MTRKKTQIIENFLDKEEIEKYDKFLKQAKFLENNKKCKYCKTKSLVHCDYEEHYLLCDNCGTIYKYNDKTKRLVIC